MTDVTYVTPEDFERTTTYLNSLNEAVKFVEPKPAFNASLDRQPLPQRVPLNSVTKFLKRLSYMRPTSLGLVEGELIYEANPEKRVPFKSESLRLTVRDGELCVERPEFEAETTPVNLVFVGNGGEVSCRFARSSLGSMKFYDLEVESDSKNPIFSFRDHCSKGYFLVLVTRFSFVKNYCVRPQCSISPLNNK